MIISTLINYMILTGDLLHDELKSRFNSFVSDDPRFEWYPKDSTIFTPLHI